MALIRLRSKRSRPSRKWIGKTEKAAILKKGGTTKKTCADGLDKNGRPIEVKAVKKDGRFRINEKPHRKMKAQGGHYVFVAPNGETKTRTARQVDENLPKGKWFKDRKYPHKFVKKEEIFK